ncbi:hypothetical protein [Blastococcus sp. CT_GayMR16]|uniref:hypothetical protein n=1 Tax=Blastococcus sp. CT_GayMR16 TaxID=2559607 RepID=UPI0010744DC8|nr:hypothetical protein [Blastococcus sp. CT_GayMR16]TFV90386.1 hypothetical protein E4P38_02800 [Blastococcus sp. CT_GayMR16]
MFHRVDEPLELPSSRFFQHAQRLYVRGGAVTAALATAGPVGREEMIAPPPPPTSSAPGISAGTPDDIAAMAAMSQNPGFPGIGYSGG